MACGLIEKKKRRQAGLFRFDGVKLFREALLTDTEITAVFLRDPVNETVDGLVRDAVARHRVSEDSVILVSESVFEKMSEEKSPEGVIVIAKLLNGLHQTATREEAAGIAREERLLLAEALRDPGNLGTVMRSCAALGIDRLILTEDCADLYNPKTVRSAMGALFRLPTLTVSADRLPELILELRSSGRRIYATALRRDAEEIGKLALRSGDCFVIGNEGHGLSEGVIRACDGAAIIPMKEGNESLNAAAAAAICIWETVRA